MASISRKKDYSPLTGGLNTRFLPPTLQDDEASVLTNAQVNNNGSIEKYPGYTKDGSPFPNAAASFIRTVFDFRRGTTIDYLLIAAADAGNANGTYKVDIKSTIGDGSYSYLTFGIGTAAFTNANTTVTGTNTSWTKELKIGDKIKLASDSDSAYTEIANVNSDTTITLVAGGYLGTTHAAAAYNARKIWNNSNIPRMCTFNNVCIITDGDGVPQQYDGSNIFGLINSYSGTTLTQQANAAPIMQGVCSHKNRVFGWKNSTIYWSHVNDQTYWDPASLEPVFPQDGGDIISIVSFADSLFCLKNNGKIYRAFGNFDDSAIGTAAFITKVDYAENIGIIGDRSTFVHNNYLYFLAETGVYSIDTRGIMQRISYYIEPTTRTFNFNVGAQTSKAFNFTTKTQWDSGTHTGSYATQDGLVHSYFDDFRQTDALLGDNKCAIAIDSNDTIHVAYVKSSDNTQINYVKYYTSGYTPAAGSNPQKEASILPSGGLAINCLSIAVASNGKVAIAYGDSSKFSTIERSADSGATSGTWGTVTNFTTVYGFGGTVTNISTRYTSGGVQGIAIVYFSGAQSGITYVQNNAGTWAHSTNFDAVSDAGISSNDYRICLEFDSSSNIYLSYMHLNTSTIKYQKSTNGGTTFSLIETFTLTHPIAVYSSMQSYLDHSNNFYTTFSDNTGVVVRRNHTAGTSSTIDSTANSVLRGAVCISRTVSAVTTDYFYYLNVTGISALTQEKYIFETSSNVTNPTTNVVANGSGTRPGDRPMVSNGQNIATVQFGQNSNELVIRRVSFYGNWQGPEQHDSTLSAWGTYVVSGSVSNGNTLTYQVALAGSSPATSFSNINSGSIISSSSVLIYNAPKFLWSLAAWGGVQLTSIVLNYTGAGIDARQAYGISFYNEAYFAASETGQSTNSKILVYDFKNKPLLTTYMVNCMERFKTNLYAGSATNGDLYVLKQGYDFAGSAYTMDVQTKEDFLGSVELKKDFYKIYVLYKVQSAGTFTFSYRFDNFTGATDGTWTNATIDQTSSGPGSSSVLSGTPGIAEIAIGTKTARSIQFRIQNANAGQSVQILGFTVLYGLTDRR